MKLSLIKSDNIKELIKEQLLKQFESTTFINLDNISIKVDTAELIKSQMPEDLKTPTIYITPEAYVKMFSLVNNTESEIAWHGVVQTFENRIYLIKEILVYPQHVTGATAESIDEEYGTWTMELTDEQINNMRLQAHSHVNMSVNPSGVDEDYYRDLLTQIEDYYIIMVVNKSRNMHVRFYDVEHNILYTDIPVDILLSGATTEASWYDEQAKQLKKRAIVPSIFDQKLGKFSSSTKESRYDAEDYADQWADFKRINTPLVRDTDNVLTVTLASGVVMKRWSYVQLARHINQTYKVGTLQEILRNLKTCNCVTFKSYAKNKWTSYWNQANVSVTYPHLIEWKVDNELK